MHKITVIYHSADYDGIFCREIAKHFMPEATFIGWNFGDPKIPMPEGDVYIMDLSPDCIENPALDCNGIIWIDHHKTSIEKWPVTTNGYRIDGVAACRLAWQWFTNQAERKHIYQPLPDKKDYINRLVKEPYAVQMAGEYDIWDKRNPDAETFQYALRVNPMTPEIWEIILGYNDQSVSLIKEMLRDGSVAQRYGKQLDENLVLHRSYQINWEGLKWIVLNTGRFNSLTFAALDKPETGHDALLGYMFNGKAWTVSLYHAKHRTDLDLSEIAKANGGGGHKGACGFTCKTLPEEFLSPAPADTQLANTTPATA